MSDAPYTNKKLGQHWLFDDASLEAMCDAADIIAADDVLEIGPGTGTLTAKLLQRGAHVVAVELDTRLADNLSAHFGDQDFELHTQSILTFDLTTMPMGYKLVANIPYYLTSHLIRVLSESANPPSVAVLLVQKEVAERVCSAPGDMSLLSVTAQYYWQANLGTLVPAKLFTPPPEVDSQILILKRRKEILFGPIDTKVFFRIVKAGFSARRKKLRGSLSGGLRISKDEADELLNKSSISPDRRAQELSLDDWYRLYQSLVQVWER